MPPHVCRAAAGGDGDLVQAEGHRLAGAVLTPYLADAACPKGALGG